MENTTVVKVRKIFALRWVLYSTSIILYQGIQVGSEEGIIAGLILRGVIRGKRVMDAFILKNLLLTLLQY